MTKKKSIKYFKDYKWVKITTSAGYRGVYGMVASDTSKGKQGSALNIENRTIKINYP